jgi:hypothetical protein
MDDVDNFLKVAEMVGRIIGLTQEHKSAESLLDYLVRVVRGHPEKKDWFETKFIEMFDDRRNYSGLVIAYCMHVLKFKKVLAHVQKIADQDLAQMRKTLGITDLTRNVIGTDDRARMVLESFSPNWKSRIIFTFPD